MFDTVRAQNALAQSIIIPAAGVPWDGLLDLVTLRTMVSQRADELDAYLYIDLRHYTPAVNMLRVGGGKAPLDWRIWLRCARVLRLVARAIESAVDKQVERLEAATPQE